MSSHFWSHNLGDLLFLLVATLIVARLAARNYIKSLWAMGWSREQGRVEMTSVTARHARYFNFYVARLDYSYTVKTEYYAGYFEKIYLREGAADDFVSSMKSQIIWVRSNPNRPERSALLLQDQPAATFSRIP